MTTSSQTAVRSIRMSANDFKARREASESVTVLDVRSQKAWDASPVKIPGAIRAQPDKLRIDSSWPKDRLTVVY